MLAIAGVLIYKFFGGRFPSFGRSATQKKLDQDTLVECTGCSVYVTVKESVIRQGQYYCSAECPS